MNKLIFIFCKILVFLFLIIAVVLIFSAPRQLTQKIIYGDPINLSFSRFIVQSPNKYELQIVKFTKDASYLSYGLIQIPSSIINFFKKPNENELSYLYLKSNNDAGAIYISEKQEVTSVNEYFEKCEQANLQCAIKKNALASNLDALEYKSENNIVYIFPNQKITVYLKNVRFEELQGNGFKFALREVTK